MQLCSNQLCLDLAMMNNLEAHIALNETDIDPTLRRVMNEIDKSQELRERFITSDDAWDMMTSKTTVVICWIRINRNWF